MTEFDDRLRGRLERLAAAVPVASPGPVVSRRSRSSGSTARARAAFGTLTLVVVVGVLAALVIGRPAPQQTGAPVRASMTVGSFRMTLESPKDRYVEDEPIEVTATIEYVGDRPSTEVRGSLGMPGFGVREVRGNREAAPAYRTACVPYAFQRHEPVAYPFVKSGGYSPQMPNAAFVRQYLNVVDGRPDPTLRLPAGTWELFASAEFAEGDCAAPGDRLEVSIVVTVTRADAGPTPPASPDASALSPSPTIPPSPASSPDATAPTSPVARAWDLAVPAQDAEPPLRLRVADRSGRVLMAAPADAIAVLPTDPRALAVERGGEPRTVVVGWTLLACVERAQLDVSADGRALELRQAPVPGSCEAIGRSYAVALAFEEAPDVDAMRGTVTDTLVGPDDLIPHSVAMLDDRRIRVGGTTRDGDAVALETDDGGGSWQVAGLLSGDVRALAGVSNRLLAGKVGTEEGIGTAGTFEERDADPGFTGKDFDGAVALDAAGASAVGVFAVDGRLRLRALEADGNTWRDVASPCRVGEQLADADIDEAGVIVALCTGQAAGPSWPKRLLETRDDGRTWTSVAETVSGWLPAPGNAVDFSSGSGWLWGPRSPLWVTTDGGRTWRSLDLVDGDVRHVIDADYLGHGRGAALVWDPDRSATLLVTTVDGATWTEVRAWDATAGEAG